MAAPRNGSPRRPAGGERPPQWRSEHNKFQLFQLPQFEFPTTSSAPVVLPAGLHSKTLKDRSAARHLRCLLTTSWARQVSNIVSISNKDLKAKLKSFLGPSLGFALLFHTLTKRKKTVKKSFSVDRWRNKFSKIAQLYFWINAAWKINFD